MARKRNRRQFKPKPSDPTRSDRIRAQRQREEALRSGLDSLLKQGRELSDRAHYFRLGKEAAETARPLLQEQPAAFQQALDRLGACLMENFALERDCRALEAKLDSLRSKPAKHDATEKILQLLPPDQADALRFVIALNKTPAEPELESKVREVFDAARRHFDEMRRRLAAIEERMRDAIAVGREKARRGWAPADEIERYVTQATKHIETQRRALENYETQFAAAVARRDELLSRRAELNRSIVEMER